MADEEAVIFLKSIKLDRFIDSFSKEGLKKADFIYFKSNPSELKEVLPALKDRIDFITALSRDFSDKGTQVEIDPPVRVRTTLREISLLHESGKQFLHYYDAHNGQYLPEHRDLIKKAVVDYFFALGKGTINAGTFLEITEIIVKELPAENRNTWYLPRCQDKPPNGLLYARYRYVKKNDKRFKDREEPPVSHQTSIVNRTKQAWEQMSEDQRHLCQSAKYELNTLGFTQALSIMKCWQDSFPLRRYEAVTGVLNVEDYAVLKHFSGINELINYDFSEINDHWTPISEKLPTFIHKFRKIFENRKSLVDEDKLLVSGILETFVENLKIDDKSIFLAFFSLPLMLRQTFIVKGKKRFKPSLLMCRESYITIVKQESNVTETLFNRRRAATENNTTIQPFIIVVGSLRDISSIFVVFDDLLYKSSGIINAVDMHFKIHAVFHLEYSPLSEYVLMFIQEYFYGITYPTQRQSPVVSTFITDVQRC